MTSIPQFQIFKGETEWHTMDNYGVLLFSVGAKSLKAAKAQLSDHLRTPLEFSYQMAGLYDVTILSS